MIPAENNSQHNRPAGCHLSLPLACSILTAAMLPAGALAGWWAYAHHAMAGLQAVLLAAVTCWLSATVALVLAGLLAGTPQAISGILGGTLVRLAGPLLVVAGCAAARSPLAAAGLFGYMAVFFLYVLVIETLLLIGLVRASSPFAPRKNAFSPSEERPCTASTKAGGAC